MPETNITGLRVPAVWRQTVGQFPWPRIWTRDYREQIQQVIRAEPELPALQPLGHAAYTTAEDIKPQE